MAFSRTPTYRSWQSMWDRCSNANHVRAADWVGRGIKVCPEWATFEAFFKDMGECPYGKSLDRINNELGYSKENCRWATMSEQNLNRRTPKTNTSGVKGVSWITKTKRWQATGKLGYKSKNLYSGYDFFLACCARKSWENQVNVKGGVF